MPGSGIPVLYTFARMLGLGYLVLDCRPWIPALRLLARERSIDFLADDSWLSTPALGFLDVDSQSYKRAIEILASALRFLGLGSWFWTHARGFLVAALGFLCSRPGFGELALECWLWHPG